MGLQGDNEEGKWGLLVTMKKMATDGVSWDNEKDGHRWGFRVTVKMMDKDGVSW